MWNFRADIGIGCCRALVVFSTGQNCSSEHCFFSHAHGPDKQKCLGAYFGLRIRRIGVVG